MNHVTYITMEDIKVIEDRMAVLETMMGNCRKIIGMYCSMNHPNREKLTGIYRRNLENLGKEFRELEQKREELMNHD